MVQVTDKLFNGGENQLEEVFAGRRPLTAEEFFYQYFAGQGYDQDVIVRIKRVFDDNISFDLSRLSSSDDFSKELSFIWTHDSLADVQTVIGLEKEFAITISDEEALQMKTFDDVAAIITRKLEGK